MKSTLETRLKINEISEDIHEKQPEFTDKIELIGDVLSIFDEASEAWCQDKDDDVLAMLQAIDTGFADVFGIGEELLKDINDLKQEDRIAPLLTIDQVYIVKDALNCFSDFQLAKAYANDSAGSVKNNERWATVAEIMGLKGIYEENHRDSKFIEKRRHTERYVANLCAGKSTNEAIDDVLVKFNIPSVYKAALKQEIRRELNTIKKICVETGLKSVYAEAKLPSNWESGSCNKAAKNKPS